MTDQLDKTPSHNSDNEEQGTADNQKVDEKGASSENPEKILHSIIDTHKI